MKEIKLSFLELIAIFIKNNIHCLFKTIFFFKSQQHHVCFERITESDGLVYHRYFCSCGYLNGGITWKNHIEMMKKYENSYMSTWDS
jgi:hypothetical protein